MAEQKPGAKKTTGITPAVEKTASGKQAPARKAAVKKAAAKKTPPVTGPASQQNSLDTLTTIKSIVDEMRVENINRDKQITNLVQEVHQGFSNYSRHSNEQSAEREKEMAKLYQSLQSAFSKIGDSGIEREERSLSILKSLSESIMLDHEQTLKEVLEQEKLQDKKFSHLTKVEEHRASRNRWIAIPGIIIAVIAIIYMFYVVTIMESAMSSMSRDIHKIQFAVVNMSDKMDGLTVDTRSMKNDMQQLNGNMGQMSKDLNVMTHNVAPAMRGMRDMMPWVN